MVTGEEQYTSRLARQIQFCVFWTRAKSKIFSQLELFVESKTKPLFFFVVSCRCDTGLNSIPEAMVKKSIQLQLLLCCDAHCKNLSSISECSLLCSLLLLASVHCYVHCCCCRVSTVVFTVAASECSLLCSLLLLPSVHCCVHCCCI